MERPIIMLSNDTLILTYLSETSCTEEEKNSCCVQFRKPSNFEHPYLVNGQGVLKLAKLDSI